MDVRESEKMKSYKQIPHGRNRVLNVQCHTTNGNVLVVGICGIGMLLAEESLKWKIN